MKTILVLDSFPYRSLLLKSKFEKPETFIRNKIPADFYFKNQSVALWERYREKLPNKLCKALKYGFFDYVNWNKCGYDFSDSIYLTAACAGGNQSLISSVMSSTPESDEYWIYGLYGACRYGDINIVSMLLSKLQLPLKSRNPLIIATLWGHYDIVKLLHNIYPIYNQYLQA